MSGSQRPLVSVLMPAYNVAPYIQQAVESVLAQTYPHFELIVADDASGDDTVALLSSFSDPRIVCMLHKTNLGYAENMNSLFQAAKGEYLVIQDADDYCSKDRLQVLVDFLQAHPHIDMVGSSYIRIDEQGNETKVLKSTNQEEINRCFETMTDPLPVLNGSVMFRRKIVEQKIGFRSLRYVNRSQDDDWLFRISERFAVANVADALYYYRFNPTSMTMNFSSITYYSIFSGAYVRFLKQVRKEKGIDLLQENMYTDIESFFQQKRKELTDEQPAYLELYIAHKYLGAGKRLKALAWLCKAGWKNPGDAFIWKKIVVVILRKK